jgi:hypothetical protein
MRVTPHSFTGRLAPAVLRPALLEDVPAGWERQAYDASSDGDALSWLGFEPGEERGEPDEPRLTGAWRTTWAAPRRAGRHRSPARRRTA